jgi:hypothetical protein
LNCGNRMNFMGTSKSFCGTFRKANIFNLPFFNKFS